MRVLLLLVVVVELLLVTPFRSFSFFVLDRMEKGKKVLHHQNGQTDRRAQGRKGGSVD